MATKTSNKPSIATASLAELEAQIKALKAKDAGEKNALVEPVLTSVLPHVTLGPSQNDKPWYGAFLSGVVTHEGTEYRVNVTITDIAESKRMKDAVKS